MVWENSRRSDLVDSFELSRSLNLQTLVLRDVHQDFVKPALRDFPVSRSPCDALAVEIHDERPPSATTRAKPCDESVDVLRGVHREHNARCRADRVGQFCLELSLRL